jgi:tRNA A-37 threonylcarbamoyl transferase component Bud32
MVMDEIADRARLAYKKVTGGDGEILWRKVGRHSHAETFCLQGRQGNEKKMVVQIFVEPSDKLIMNERYKRVMEISKVYGQDDLCRFVRPIACLPEYDGIVTDYIDGVDFWLTMRRQCRRLSWIDIETLLQHVRNLAIWTVRLDSQTRNDIGCENIIQSTLEISANKIKTIQMAGLFSNEQAKACLATSRKLGEELASQHLYSVLCHGDLCPANILFSDSFLHVVDIHRIHRGLPFEDAAYFLSTFNILRMESFRYNPEKVEQMKTVFWETYRSYVKPSDILYAFQYLNTQIQVLNYYVSVLRDSRGIRYLNHCRRVRQLRKQLLDAVSGSKRVQYSD